MVGELNILKEKQNKTKQKTKQNKTKQNKTTTTTTKNMKTRKPHPLERLKKQNNHPP